jgi:hypothetical protein
VIEEAGELERAAEWRMRKVDADTGDAVSRDAAALLERLAAEVRALDGSAVAREYGAICNWLGESGEIADFMDMVGDRRARIGVDWVPENGASYIWSLVELAKRTFGAV